MPAPSQSGKTIALAEGRQLEDLAQMLAKEGASIWRCPMVSMLDPSDDGPMLEWLEELNAGRFAWVVLLTGEGLRRLLACTDRHQIRAEVLAGFKQTKIITRGPKPGQALREVGLAPSVVAKMPTTEGVIDSLKNENLRGLTVGVQLYRAENPPLLDFLQQAEASVQTVLPYLYAPASDGEKIVDLIEAMAAGRIDVVVFTSSPQVDRLYEVADEKGLTAQLASSWTRTKVAAVGPIVAQTLQSKGVHVAICPEQGFQMKNLVVHIQRALAK